MTLNKLAAQSENLVQNPGFESEKDGWVLFLAPGSEGAGATFEIGSDQPHGGTSSAKLNANLPIRYGLYPKEAIPVAPGERYKLTAWVRFSDDAELKGSAPAAYLRAALFEAPKVDTGDPLGHMHIGLNGKMARNPDVAKLGVSELPKGWQKIEGVVEIPAGVTLMGFTLFDQGVVGGIYWDDVTIEKVDAKTPLSPAVTD